MRAKVRASACDSGVSKESLPRSIRLAIHTPVIALERLASGTGSPTTARPMATSRTGWPAWRMTMPPVRCPYFAAQLRQACSIPSTVWARTGSIAAKKAVTSANRKSRRIVSTSGLDLQVSISRSLPSVSHLQPLLARAAPLRDAEAGEPVDGAGEDIGFHVHADPGRAGEGRLADAQQVEQRDDQHQGRVLEQSDEPVGHGGES